jgi:hypothetical protein
MFISLLFQIDNGFQPNLFLDRKWVSCATPSFSLNVIFALLFQVDDDFHSDLFVDQNWVQLPTSPSFYIVSLSLFQIDIGSVSDMLVNRKWVKLVTSSLSTSFSFFVFRSISNPTWTFRRSKWVIPPTCPSRIIHPSTFLGRRWIRLWSVRGLKVSEHLDSSRLTRFLFYFLGQWMTRRWPSDWSSESSSGAQYRRASIRNENQISHWHFMSELVKN